ncbi:uncharacterized protein LOC119082550 [Bradysia coprophila]|uniref:uncharacterized protein LOC119082550 n=1 Tax=Bradysia coprophila TaxID=38358 RepID=UPI00187DBA3C|nr:uncharacterized protein LOC119082550 [Bradysia coprophila]
MKFSFFCLIVSLFVTSNSAFDADRQQLVDYIVEDLFMATHRVPGAGVSVVRNGTVLMSKGYGMRNISARLASDGNTLFSIGSISKSFVAVLVVKTLNELHPNQGAGVLDIPIAQLIPPTVNFTLSDRYRAEHATFRDILSHRTCLMNGAFELIVGTLPSASEYAYRSRYLPQDCDFRSGFVYNSNMISLAGEIIAAIAGTTLQNMIVSLARDLGMANTTYIDLNGSYESHPGMSQPYILKNGTIVAFDTFQVRKIHMGVGTGGVLSTSNDMAKYMNFHLNNGRVGDRQIVPENVMRWLYSTSNAFDFQGGRTEDDSMVYGNLGAALGLFSGLYDGWSVIFHDGYWPPYHCEMRLFPATQIGVFICVNGPGLIIDYPMHENVILNIFELARGTNISLAELLSKKVNIAKPNIEHQLFKEHKTNRAATALHHSQIRSRVEPADVLGVYGHPINGDLSIRYAPGTGNTTLQLYLSEWTFGRLQPFTGSNTTFSIEWDTTIMDHFYSYPWAVPNFWIDFGIVDTALLRLGELDLYGEFEFVKNATLDTFPSIPWTPGSCGPEL